MSHWAFILSLLFLLCGPICAQESEENVGTATATEDPWEGFRYEDHGLTQWEFQQVKEAGMSREKVLNLLELGIRPNEYLQKPWIALGLSEEDWLNERSEGMEDSDIDRTYRVKARNQHLAYWSLLVPSLYQWKADESTKALSMDILWVSAVGATAFLAATSANSEWIYGAIMVAGVHAWSFLDAFNSTQWENNPNANRFSWGVIPTPHRGVAGAALFRF